MKSNRITGLSIFGLMQISCVLLLIFSILPLIASAFWVFDLFTHFRVQYLIIAVALTTGFILMRKRAYVSMAVMVVVINAVYVIPIYSKTSHNAGGVHGKHLKIFQANVLTSNTQYASLVDQIITESPDIVVLQEIDSKWLTELNVLKAQYSHNIAVPSKDNFGMAIYSKIPITNHVVHKWSDFDIPNIEAIFDLDGNAFQMIATHLLPPVNKRFFTARKTHFEAMANAINAAELPSIVLGDFNTTGWSDEYKNLKSSTGLINTSNGFGYIPTWPTTLAPLMIPIDHCLVSKDFRVNDFRSGQRFGSDHWPLIIELNL